MCEALSDLFAAARGGRAQLTASDDTIFEKPALEEFPARRRERLNVDDPTRLPRPRCSFRTSLSRCHRASSRSCATRHVFTTLHVAPAARDPRRPARAGTRRGTATSRAAATTVSPQEGLRFFPLFPMLARALSWLPGVERGARGRPRRERERARCSGSSCTRSRCTSATTRCSRGARCGSSTSCRSRSCSSWATPKRCSWSLAGRRSARVASARWWIAAVAGILAGLTRPVGVLLAVPAAVEGWQHARRQSDRRRVARPVAGLGRVSSCGPSTAPHDFLYPLRVQQDATPARRLGRPVPRGRPRGARAVHGDHVSAGIHAVTALVLVVLLVVLSRRWPLVVHALRRGGARRRARQPQPRLARALQPLDGAVRARRRRRHRHRDARARRARRSRRPARRRVRPRVHRVLVP